MPPREPPRPYRERQESSPFSGLWPRSTSVPDIVEAQRAQAGQIIATQAATSENTRRLGVVEHLVDKVETAVAEVGKGVGEIKHSIALQQAIVDENDKLKAQSQQRTIWLIGLLFSTITILVNVALRFL